MDVSVNILELASELAHKVVEKEMKSHLRIDSDGSVVYTEEAQDLFNEWYDYYYDLIWNLKN